MTGLSVMQKALKDPGISALKPSFIMKVFGWRVFFPAILKIKESKYRFLLLFKSISSILAGVA